MRDAGPSDDVLVVGARCAGAAAAMLLARAGLRVRMIDRARAIRDTVNGSVVKPAGVARLARWGLLDAVLATGCPPITAGSLRVDGTERPPTASPAGGFPSLAPRRACLDPLLLDAARRAGACIELGTLSTGVVRRDGRISGVETARGRRVARLVAADGRNSTFARLVGARRTGPPRR